MSWKSSCCLMTIALFVLVLPQGCSNSDSDNSANEKYIEAYSSGTQAYIWGYPLVSNFNRFRAVSRVTEINVKNKTLPRAPVNQICFLSDYVTPDERGIVAPNHDTVYGSAWLDLGIEPIVLRMPDMGNRFWIFEMCDFYTDVFASPGTRFGSPAGDDVEFDREAPAMVYYNALQQKGLRYGYELRAVSRLSTPVVCPKNSGRQALRFSQQLGSMVKNIKRYDCGYR